MTDKKREPSQNERIKSMLDAGEIITSADMARRDKPIIDLPKRMSELRGEGYPWDKVKSGKATAYYNPYKVDHGELAAWVAKPMIKAV